MRPRISTPQTEPVKSSLGFHTANLRRRVLLTSIGALVLLFSVDVRAELPDFTALVKANEAAVVNISTVGEVPSRRSNVSNDPRL